MENLSTVLKTRRKALGLTLAQIADAMGVSEATVQRWESGNIKSVRYEKIDKLAEILRVNPADFMGWDAATFPPNVQPMPGTYRVPRLGTIACGEPILAEQNIDGYDEVPNYIKCDFTLVCKGDSMTGARIFDGDIVCIKSQGSVENGQIAAIRVDGEFESEATLKRVRFSANGVTLWPENPAYEPLIYAGDDAQRVHILGLATHFISTVK